VNSRFAADDGAVTTETHVMPPETTSAIATFAWVLRAKAFANQGGDRTSVESWLLRNGAPGQAVRIFKAAVGTTDSDLGPYGGIAISAWADALRTRSAFYRILADGGFLRAPLNTRVAIATAPATGSIVGEGEAVPMSIVTMQGLLLSPIKASALIANTNEAWLDISAAGQLHLSRQIAGAISDAVDTAFLDMVLSTGSTSTASAGTTAVNAKHDLRTALLAVNTIGSAKLYWIAAVDVAKKASTLSDTGGGDAFSAMSATGGELAGLPCIVSSGVPSGSLFLIDASGIAADGGPVTETVSSQADILMRTDPTMPAAMTSMWQTNCTAMKGNAVFGAQVLRDDAVAQVHSINWGA
jgi:hypothetical protein